MTYRIRMDTRFKSSVERTPRVLEVAEAFGLKDQAALFKRDDVKPFSASPQIAMSTIVLFVILILVVFIMSSCISSMGSSGGGYRSSGGSYGGYSSGGGHK